MLRLKKQHGFSLVELMLVVSIIGVLAALAIPEFQIFQAKAKQSEATMNVNHIYTLQMSYFGDNDQYWNGFGIWGLALQPIGFTAQGHNRYIYSTGGGTSTFLIGAQSITNDIIRAGCGHGDILFMDDTRNYTRTADCGILP